MANRLKKWMAAALILLLALGMCAPALAGGGQLVEHTAAGL